MTPGELAYRLDQLRDLVAVVGLSDACAAFDVMRESAEQDLLEALREAEGLALRVARLLELVGGSALGVSGTIVRDLLIGPDRREGPSLAPRGHRAR